MKMNKIYRVTSNCFKNIYSHTHTHTFLNNAKKYFCNMLKIYTYGMRCIYTENVSEMELT